MKHLKTLFFVLCLFTIGFNFIYAETSQVIRENTTMYRFEFLKKEVREILFNTIKEKCRELPDNINAVHIYFDDTDDEVVIYWEIDHLKDTACSNKNTNSHGHVPGYQEDFDWIRSCE